MYSIPSKLLTNRRTYFVSAGSIVVGPPGHKTGSSLRDQTRMVSSPGEGGVPDGELPPHRGQADHQGPGDTRAGRGVSVLGEKRGGSGSHKTHS